MAVNLMPEENIKTALKWFFKNNLGIDTEVNSVREIQWGYLSRVYLANMVYNGWRMEVVIKNVKNKTAAYMYDADRLRAYQLSHFMFENADGNEVKSYGIMLAQNWKCLDMLTINSEIEVFHVQAYKHWKNYLEIFNELSEKSELSEKDREMISEIAKKIAKIHSKKIDIPRADEKATYERWFLELTNTPELMFNVLSNFPENHKYFWACTFKYDYLSKMFETCDIYRMNRAGRRPTHLHGDFWMSNILIDNTPSAHFIDFTKIPFWDPGIDIWWFVSYALLTKIATGKEIYLDFARFFMDEYKKFSWDENVLKYWLQSLLWMGIIFLSPNVWGSKDPKLADEIISKILNNVKRCEIILD